jgi:hypothetical protein
MIAVSTWALIISQYGYVIMLYRVFPEGRKEENTLTITCTTPRTLPAQIITGAGDNVRSPFWKNNE